MRFNRTSAAGLTLLTSIALVACSSSNSGKATASPSASGSSASGSSAKPGAPIVIEGEGSLTGFSNGEDGVNARLKRVNDAGGVDGHKIVFKGIVDNGGSGDKSLSTIRQLVQRDKVDAIVPEYPTVLPLSAAAFLKQQNVPYVGLGYAPAMCNNAAGFAFNGCNVPGVAKGSQASLVQNLPKTVGATDNLDGKTIGVIGTSIAGGQAFVDEIAGLAKDQGAKVVFQQAQVPQGATNVQAFVDPLLAAKPDITFVVTDLVTASAIQGTMLANGYKGALVNSSAYLPGIIETVPALAKALDGSWITTVIPTPLDNSPASDQLVADFKATGGKITFGSLIAYEATDLYIGLLEKAGGDPKKVISVGSGGFTWTQASGGFTTSFPAARNVTSPCSGMVRLLAGKYSSVAAFSCLK